MLFLEIVKQKLDFDLEFAKQKRKHISRKSAVHSTLITTFGLKRNKYSGAFTNVVTMDELF